jgi:hypothetical protein
MHAFDLAILELTALVFFSLVEGTAIAWQQLPLMDFLRIVLAAVKISTHTFRTAASRMTGGSHALFVSTAFPQVACKF